MRGDDVDRHIEDFFKKEAFTVNSKQWREQLKAVGLATKKRKGLEVLEVKSEGGDFLFAVTYAELSHFSDVKGLLIDKLRSEYMPPLG